MAAALPGPSAAEDSSGAVTPGAGELPDGDLVRSAQSGSTQAFELLVTRYRGKIYAMILNMTSSDADSWDLSQEVFIKAWRALPRFEARSQFFTWIFRISHNTVCDWLRRKHKENAAGEFDDAMGNVPAAGALTVPHGSAEPDRAMETRELGHRIREALAQLSPEHRAVILLKEIDGLSYQEIADATGCQIGTVMSRLFYALKHLQSLLKDVYHARHPNHTEQP